ncbi:MAG: DMT family transporter [Granulosicoccaceae bacterium]
MDQRPTTKQSPTFTDYAWLLGLALMFGSSFTFTSIAVREIPPITLAALRVTMALVILFLVMKLYGQRLPMGKRVWGYVFASAFFGNVLPFSLIGWGQIKVEAGLAAIFMAIMPLVTIMLAQFFTHDERLNRYKVLGVALGLIGVMVLIGIDALGAIGDETLRQLAIVLAATCYAVNAIITKELVGHPRKSVMAALMLAAVILFVPLVLIEQPWAMRPSQAANLSLLVLAIGPTALGTLMILVIIDRQGASFFGQINFLIPVIGVFFGVVFLGERLSANAWLALALILIGVALSRRGNQR